MHSLDLRKALVVRLIGRLRSLPLIQHLHRALGALIAKVEVVVAAINVHDDLLVLASGRARMTSLDAVLHVFIALIINLHARRLHPWQLQSRQSHVVAMFERRS